MSGLITTIRQRQVYTLLINPDNPNYPRTQADVARLLELKPERVSEAVRSLIKMSFIRQLTEGRRDLLYRRGPNYQIIESQIETSWMESAAWFDTYGQAFAPLSNASPEGRAAYNPTWRTHLNGGWIQFIVLEEGELYYIDYKTEKPKGYEGPTDQLDRATLRQALFSKKPSKQLPGQTNYYTSLIHEGALIQLRYQRTPNVRYMYICPGEVQQTTEQLDNTDLSPFMRYCFPILAWLEKFGGWKFQKEPQSNQYVYRAEVRKEFAADPLTSQILIENLGENYGIIGQSPVYVDRSKGIPEAETSRADYAHYLGTMPAHFKALYATTQTLEQRLAAIEARQQMIIEILENQTRISELQTHGHKIAIQEV